MPVMSMAGVMMVIMKVVMMMSVGKCACDEHGYNGVIMVIMEVVMMMKDVWENVPVMSMATMV